MERAEAKRVLRDELRRYRKRSYRELQALLAEPEVFTVTGASGAEYQIEVQAVWDDRPGGRLRVLGSIDDGGLRAYAPLSDDFLVDPEGRAGD